MGRQLQHLAAARDLGRKFSQLAERNPEVEPRLGRIRPDGAGRVQRLACAVQSVDRSQRQAQIMLRLEEFRI